jgi:hypothetical protein
MLCEERDIITCGSDPRFVPLLCSSSFFVSFRSWLTLRDERRPGILVLINDTDWDLVRAKAEVRFLEAFSRAWQQEGGPDYEVRDRDVIVFISTLHGG